MNRFGPQKADEPLRTPTGGCAASGRNQRISRFETHPGRNQRISRFETQRAAVAAAAATAAAAEGAASTPSPSPSR